MQATSDSPSGRLTAIVPAAGVGARAADGTGPKQYRPIAGTAMLVHTVRALLAEPRIDRVLVAVAPGDAQAANLLAGVARVQVLACGGATRYDSVANALAAAGLAGDDWVLVHDAARPGLPADALAALIDACLPDPVGGLLALPVADTVKRAGEGEAAPRVEATLSREHLWQAQTPQMFRAGLLSEAFARVRARGEAPTDEAGAVEALGARPLLVRGSFANLKVTWPQDFIWMEKWLG
ncbi:2-C-methyl-D-erythritol 4-phosphate cytidylyltransferase [Verticiella sediminum]|uniref:2-C-methyl-D-erythritol 4-phosphate cytidylyltransferase n=1 Tax=Verticiella sediminum TaxID=1247510 RepID=A0A556AVY9_9BURK|nr:2-C-methyl-D-erythritol 4-phosphate cytidylyltransferase [Verticiella sediminum]TSH97111.1 2-C-methyl-D-erythritol 4-phosphate cytidylyltransferase [Verticiella sediminum]